MEVLAGLKGPHNSKTKSAAVIAKAYGNLATRMFDTLSGGGKFPAVLIGVPALKSGIQTALLLNYASQGRINFFNQIAPYIYTFWAGQIAIGPTGQSVITYTGKFQGPPVPETNSFEVWLNVFVGVIALHFLTMTGTYTNYYSGVTTPWSGALLTTFP